MEGRARLTVATTIVVVAAMLLMPAVAQAQLTDKESLGKALFFDEALSTPDGLSCATCHDPAYGYADPRPGPTSQGIVPTRFGNRNSPTAAYAFMGPQALMEMGGGMGGGGMGGGGMGGGMGGVKNSDWRGGTFWDGRADNLTEQAKGPFLNPLEMHNPNEKAVILDVRRADYAELFKDVYGPQSLKDVDAAYDDVADAIAAYEKSEEVNPFSSKFDHVMAGEASFTATESAGWAVFRGAGQCSSCHHIPTMGGGGMGGGGMGGGGMGGGGMGGGGMGGGGCGSGGCDCGNCGGLFTDHGYWNLGSPKNPENPFYSQPEGVKFNPLQFDWIDYGLGAVLQARGVEGYESQMGKVKTPTLRNVAVTAPYMRNGEFEDLMTVIHFYNVRDVAGATMPDGSPIPAPEVNANIVEPGISYRWRRGQWEMIPDMGNLGLTQQQGMQLVAFLNTLTDGWEPPQ